MFFRSEKFAQKLTSLEMFSRNDCSCTLCIHRECDLGRKPIHQGKEQLLPQRIHLVHIFALSYKDTRNTSIKNCRKTLAHISFSPHSRRIYFVRFGSNHTPSALRAHDSPANIRKLTFVDDSARKNMKYVFFPGAFEPERRPNWPTVSTQIANDDH